MANFLKNLFQTFLSQSRRTQALKSLSLGPSKTLINLKKKSLNNKSLQNHFVKDNADDATYIETIAVLNLQPCAGIKENVFLTFD